MAARFYVATEAAKPVTGYSVGDFCFVQSTVKLYQADASLVWTSPTSLVELPMGNNMSTSQYKLIIDASASHIAGRVAGTYALGYGGAAAITGVGTLYPIAIIRLLAADYPPITSTLVSKLRVSAQIAINDVAPTGNYTFGLHPISRPTTSGGTGVVIYTIGAAVAGSTVLFTTPAADALLSGVSTDFSLPADGFYCLGVVTTATVATNSHCHLTAQLQMRNN